MSEDFKYELLENGLDFIDSGLKYIVLNDEKSDLKYALLHIGSGIELILKERLRLEHWLLIFQNIDNAKLELLESGDFISVNFHDCLRRLTSICDIEFNTEDFAKLKDLKKRRNKVEHYGIQDSPEATVASLTRVLSFMLDFIVNEIPIDDISDYDRKRIDEIKKQLFEFQEFIDTRLKQLEPEFNKLIESGVIIALDCIHCYQTRLIIGDGNVKCMFCRYEVEPTKAAEEYVNRLFNINHYIITKDGGEYPIYICPECEDETLINMSYNIGVEEYICFNCAGSWKSADLKNCMDCNNLYISKEENQPPFCEDCTEYRLSK